MQTTRFYILYLLNIAILLLSQPLLASESSPASGEPASEQVRLLLTDMGNSQLREVVEQNGTDAFSGINKAFLNGQKPELNMDYATSSFSEALLAMWDSAPFYIDEETLILRLAELPDGGYEIRDIPLMFSDAEEQTHYEEAVAEFTPEGRLRDIRIAMPIHRYNRLMNQADGVVDINRRRHILAFVEQFRTAYNSKDLDFIEQVFSDEALIIVGKVVESSGEKSPYEQQVRYLRQSKSEYIERLRSVFARNEWIDITFDELSLIRHPRHDYLYGVSLQQQYSSATYSDEGYLFLLIDFQNEERPLIHVRTWQPLYETPEQDVFSIGEIEIF
jgi:hypothetical protein